MKHANYEDGKTVWYQIDKTHGVSIKLSSIGITPSKVAAYWSTGEKSGIAIGGFQDRKYFDFQTAAASAFENALSQATR